MNFPILTSLILLPAIGSFFIFFVKFNKNYQSSKYVALFISLANFVLALYLWSIFDNSSSEFQFIEEKNGYKVILIIKLE